MKPYLYSLIAAAAFTGLASAQTNAYTTPVGYATATLTAGNNPFAPSFINSSSFAGSMTSAVESGATTIITKSAAGWILNAYNFEGSTGFPLYYVEITQNDPAKEGYSFDILSNTATTVTVSGKLLTDFGMLGTENFEIRKHVTVGQALASTTPPLTGFADSIKLFNSNGSEDTLFWDGTIWTPDFVADHSNRPVYPGTGFLTVLGAAVDVTDTGTVKTTATKVPVTSGVLNFVAPLSPVTTQVGNLDLVPSLAAFADNIKVLLQDGSLAEDATYFTDGTVMTKDFALDHGADSVAVGNSFLFNAGANGYWTIPAPYPVPAAYP